MDSDLTASAAGTDSATATVARSATALMPAACTEIAAMPRPVPDAVTVSLFENERIVQKGCKALLRRNVLPMSLLYNGCPIIIQEEEEEESLSLSQQLCIDCAAKSHILV